LGFSSILNLNLSLNLLLSKPFVNDPLKPGPIDQIKCLFFSGKEVTGSPFHILHNLQGLVGREVIFLNRRDGEID
jgi:hypothetical protein